MYSLGYDIRYFFCVKIPFPVYKVCLTHYFLHKAPTFTKFKKLPSTQPSMVPSEPLKEYADSLPENMPLKKRIIRVIMKENKPLTQSELRELLGLKDWSNLKRILDDLLEEGLIVKKQIGKRSYYVKVDIHDRSDLMKDDHIHYFIDLFEPELEGEEEYIRIKQAIQKDRDTFEKEGHIAIRKTKFKEFISKLKEVEKKWFNKNS